MSATSSSSPDLLDSADMPTTAPMVDITDSNTSSPPSTVGQKFQVARQETGLTIAEVAQSLKFSVRQIEALEADDYAALPGNTIVRGFVRSYARLLKLDPESLLQMLDQRSPNAPAEIRPPDNMGVASQASGLRQLTPVASAAIVIGLAALLLGLWHLLGPALTKSAGVGGSDQNVSQKALATLAVQEPMSPPASVAAPLAVTAEAGASVPASANGDMAGTTLLFVFEDRSWLEVSDSSKQVLHSGENLAGTQLILTGHPPFDIVIGNARKVKLTYGERAIDLVPHTRAEVARLKLE